MTGPLKLLGLVEAPRGAHPRAPTRWRATQRRWIHQFQFASLMISFRLVSWLRSCCLASGECSIADQFRTLFFEDFIPSQRIVFCRPCIEMVY